MSKVLQKFLEDKNFKMFLKYDGERVQKKYTFKFFNKKDPLDNYGGDTDNIEKTLTNILEEIGESYTEEQEMVVKTFNKIEKMGIDKYGFQCIIVLLLEKQENEMSYILRLNTLDKKISLHYQYNDFDEFIKEVKILLL